MKFKKALLLLLLLPVLLGSGCTAYNYAMCQSMYKGDATAYGNAKDNRIFPDAAERFMRD